jgi:4'-phosphopantetheinyl transferase
LTVDEVHVWRARLDPGAPTLARLAATLSREENERASRFVFPVHGRRYVAAHGWLRLVLAAHLDEDPAAVRLTGRDGEKPRLAGRRGLRFNLSHSEDVAVVAVARDHEVGVDVERLRPLDGLEALAAATLSRAEALAWAALPEPLRLPAFLEAWTRKEAFLKAVGEGLSRPLDSFDVTVAPGDPVRLLRVEGDAAAPARFELRALRPADGFVGTLAVERRGLRLLLRDAERELA